jgi:hypothetical protein
VIWYFEHSKLWNISQKGFDHIVTPRVLESSITLENQPENPHCGFAHIPQIVGINANATLTICCPDGGHHID